MAEKKAIEYSINWQIEKIIWRFVSDWMEYFSMRYYIELRLRTANNKKSNHI